VTADWRERTLVVLADEKTGEVLGFGRMSIESDGRGQPPAEARVVALPGQAVYEILVPEEIYSIGSIAELERMYHLEVSEDGTAQFRRRKPEAR
jgi:hypothetical protein